MDKGFMKKNVASDEYVKKNVAGDEYVKKKA